MHIHKVPEDWLSEYYRNVAPNGRHLAYYCKSEHVGRDPRLFVFEYENEPDKFYLKEWSPPLVPQPVEIYELEDTEQKYKTVSGPYDSLPAAMAAYNIYLSSQNHE